MAKSRLLNTSTKSFLELLGNGMLYRVPPFQRDYSWEKEQWEDLWNDIVDIHGRTDEPHYMGAVVVEGTSDREFLIIDGQQRLATLSIIGLAVLKRLQILADNGIDPEKNRERIDGLRNRFIGEKDPASLLENSKLVLNENDDGFYQDYLVQLRSPINKRGLSRSNKLLWDCFEYFYRRIEKHEQIASDGESLARLLNETVARQLLFILIVVDDDVKAYTVFETLNARGLELSATDLIKNYLFSCAKSPTDHAALHRQWRQLLATVRADRFPEFLRYHMLCQQPKIRSQRLFKIIRENVKTVEDVFRLLHEIEARAELFTALSDPGHEYWIDRSECKPYIRDLCLFGVRQFTPILFAAWEAFDNRGFERTLKLICVVAFRHTVVTGLNTNELEPVSHEAAKAILGRNAKGPADVFKSLRDIYVDDERFKQAFGALDIPTHGRKKSLARYVLCRLESDASGRTVDPETDSGTIEHVLPENPSSDWEEVIPPERWEKWVYRISNLVLLEPPLNREAGNSPYSDKVGIYQKSKYVLARDVAEHAPHSWSIGLMEERQRRLAERAAHVWRSDFAEPA